MSWTESQHFWCKPHHFLLQIVFFVLTGKFVTFFLQIRVVFLLENLQQKGQDNVHFFEVFLDNFFIIVIMLFLACNGHVLLVV